MAYHCSSSVVIIVAICIAWLLQYIWYKYTSEVELSIYSACHSVVKEKQMLWKQAWFLSCRMSWLKTWQCQSVILSSTLIHTNISTSIWWIAMIFGIFMVPSRQCHFFFITREGRTGQKVYWSRLDGNHINNRSCFTYKYLVLIWMSTFYFEHNVSGSAVCSGGRLPVGSRSWHFFRIPVGHLRKQDGTGVILLGLGWDGNLFFNSVTGLGWDGTWIFLLEWDGTGVKIHSIPQRLHPNDFVILYYFLFLGGNM